MTKHLWEVEHPYYCETGNYFNNDCHQRYGSWASFYEEWGDADPDYNLLFRWDWITLEDGREHHGLELFFMGQRKARSSSCEVVVTEADEPAVRAYLQRQWDHMRKLWAPLPDEAKP